MLWVKVNPERPLLTYLANGGAEGYSYQAV